MSAFCKNDKFTVLPGKTWRARTRGTCLITKIKAAYKNTPTAGGIISYTSPGTSYAEFEIKGGRIARPEPLTAAERTYKIGLYPELGGYVFQVSSDGKHGLVVETQDQGREFWDDANILISTPTSHSINGAKFRDWRMPTLDELNKIYDQRLAIGSFSSNYYWSSTVESNPAMPWVKNFNGGSQNKNGKMANHNLIRSVRVF